MTEFEMFESWLADPKNANHPNRAAMQRDFERMGGSGASHGATGEEALARQVLASAGIKPAAPTAKATTEEALARQIVKSLPN